MPVKNNCAVEFEETLYLDPFCTTGALSAKPNQPISSPLLDSHHYKYRLSALVVHFGAHSYGHFVTFRKHRPSGTWFRTSDESVYQTSLDMVLGSNPFLLFYELDRGPSVPTQQTQFERATSIDRVVHRAACEQRH